MDEDFGVCAGSGLAADFGLVADFRLVADSGLVAVSGSVEYLGLAAVSGLDWLPVLDEDSGRDAAGLVVSVQEAEPGVARTTLTAGTA